MSDYTPNPSPTTRIPKNAGQRLGFYAQNGLTEEEIWAMEEFVQFLEKEDEPTALDTGF